MAFQVNLQGVDHGEPIPDRFAKCIARDRRGDNISPALTWSDAPQGTRSFALVVVDRDSPQDRTQANTAGQSLQRTAPRRDFYHWLLADIPPAVRSIREGGDGGGVKGQNSFGPRGIGANGYDGPSPPWNDELWHRYVFRLFALDVASLHLEAGFWPEDLLAAMEGHVLAEAETMHLYSTNATLWAAT